jgi:hypothetical protein
MPTPTAITLSPAAVAVAAKVKAWAAALPHGTATVEEETSSNYGGTLIHLRPAASGAMDVTIGLGSDTSVDVFWGNGYRWEGMAISPAEVLDICVAIASGRVTEEVVRLTPFLGSRRSTILLPVGPASDGTLWLPSFLQKWAKREIVKFAPWQEGAAEQADAADEVRVG